MLLASIGPLLVGFTGLNDDPEDLAEGAEEAPEETADDPVETVDVETFIENARITSDNVVDATVTRGTDQDEEFIAETDVSVHHDASGGQDTLTGANLNDTLAGGEGEDIIEGGEGDDALFGAFGRETRADDEDADTLDGGAGDDTLFLGDGDTANGGEGQDVFVATQDAVEEIEISDFSVDEDALAIETTDPEETSVIDQTIEDGGLRVEISTGLILRLEGVEAPLEEGSIQFIDVNPLEALEA
ncbi:calcium-binding protein [Sulfitobacter donghicola]|nr:type I secretion protein [Sulfitobacter donghicola]